MGKLSLTTSPVNIGRHRRTCSVCRHGQRDEPRSLLRDVGNIGQVGRLYGPNMPLRRGSVTSFRIAESRTLMVEAASFPMLARQSMSNARVSG